MKKILTVLLAIVVFLGVMMCMRQPAYTDIQFIPEAEADISTTVPTTTKPVHIHQYETQTTPATCITPAVITHICACGDMYHEMTTELAAHEYNIVTSESTCTESGYSEYICTVCDYRYTDNITAPLQHDYVATIINPTCIQNGYTLYECSRCDESYTSDYTEKSSHHVWTEWKITKDATPVHNGTRMRECKLCHTHKSEVVKFQWAGSYAVYIPNTNIHAEFVVAEFEQSSVDKNDIIYSTPVNETNPFILGHNTRTMETLYDVQIGQYIYVNWNNEVRVYKVVISEFALQNDTRTDMIGQTTGTSIWDSVGDETLHLYTCYGAIKDHRWMVLAKRV